MAKADMCPSYRQDRGAVFKHLLCLACRLAALKSVSILLRLSVPLPFVDTDLNQDLTAMTIADTAQRHDRKPFFLRIHG
jgi:hypothetical protein